MADKLQKLDPLYIQAYHQLKNDLTNGTLKPGERLTDQQLADLLGISRTPVREAVRILCREGLLMCGGGGVTVYKPTIKDVCEVFLLRSSMESLAVSTIALNSNRKEIVTSNLQPIVQQSNTASENKDFTSLQQLNTDFHRALIDFSGLEVLKEAYAPLDSKMKIFRFFPFSLKKDLHRKISIKEHAFILDTILEGNVLTCKLYVKKHVLSAAKRVIAEFLLIEGAESSEITEATINYIDLHLNRDL